VEEKVTFTVWGTAANGLTTHYTTSGDTPGMQEIERLTNVHLEFIQPAAGTERESFNLMMNTQEYQDIMTMSYASTSLDKYVEDEVIIDATDFIKHSMPNYMSWMNDDPTLKKDVTTDYGKMAAVYSIFDEPNIMWGGIAMRQDFLDDLGESVPETYDDWHRVLTGFKNLGVEAPMMLHFAGFNPISQGVECGGYGVNNTFFMRNGKVAYGPVEPGFKEYVTMMNQWYTEGLIDKDFYSRGFWFFPATEYIYTDKTGAFFASYGMLGDVLVTTGAVADPDTDSSESRTLLRIRVIRTTSVWAAHDTRLPGESAQQLKMLMFLSVIWIGTSAKRRSFPPTTASKMYLIQS
jgi:putative aldouronate transport system substrate-binding protein